jgi:hypothetical protein
MTQGAMLENRSLFQGWFILVLMGLEPFVIGVHCMAHEKIGGINLLKPTFGFSH